jgi:hypothetical protein
LSKLSPGLFANWRASINNRPAVFWRRTGRPLRHAYCGRLNAS